MITPELRKLIDDINIKYRNRIVYEYTDGKRAVLTADSRELKVSSNSPELLFLVAKVLDKLMRGGSRELDNFEK